MSATSSWLQGMAKAAMSAMNLTQIDTGGPVQSYLPIAVGTVTAPGAGTAVVVADTGVTATSMIVLTPKTPGGTQAGYNLTTVTASTGWQVTFGSSDTTVYNWARFG